MANSFQFWSCLDDIWKWGARLLPFIYPIFSKPRQWVAFLLGIVAISIPLIHLFFRFPPKFTIDWDLPTDSNIIIALVKEPGVIWPFTIFCLLFSSIILFRRFLGPELIPAGLLRAFNHFNPLAFYRLPNHIHFFEHTLWEQKAHLQFAGAHEIDRKEAVGKLLEPIRQTIASFIASDVSVTVKVFTTKQGSPCVAVNDANLKTYLRCPSSREEKRTAGGSCTLPARKDSEVYELSDENAEQLKENEKGLQKSARVNSAYNHCVNDPNHYWIGNDLQSLSKKNQYYNTSGSYEKYYNSQAVFLIAPPLRGIDVREVTENRTPRGLLVIDSLDVAPFDNKGFAKLVGYFVHRLFSLMAESGPTLVVKKFTDTPLIPIRELQKKSSPKKTRLRVQKKGSSNVVSPKKLDSE